MLQPGTCPPIERLPGFDTCELLCNAHALVASGPGPDFANVVLCAGFEPEGCSPGIKSLGRGLQVRIEPVEHFQKDFPFISREGAGVEEGIGRSKHSFGLM